MRQFLKSLVLMTAECPTCGESFKNEMGVRSHHSQTHGGPGISVEKVTVGCGYCGNNIEKYPSVVEESDLHFCDGDCHRKWQSECKPAEEHNWYEGGPVNVECAWCGTEMDRKRCLLERSERFYCSTDCEANWKSENQGAYRWDNSKDSYNGDYYGANWERQREKRLMVDDYKCVICGMSEEEHKEFDRGLSVHHITPIDEFRQENNYVDGEKANRLDNLVTLCRKCHKRWEGVGVFPDGVGDNAKNRAISDLTSAGALAVSELTNE